MSKEWTFQVTVKKRTDLELPRNAEEAFQGIKFLLERDSWIDVVDIHWTLERETN